MVVYAMTNLPTLKRDKRLNIVDDVERFTPRADQFYLNEARWIVNLKHDAYNARRFIFGDEASLELGKWINSCEDLLLDNRHFAKPPFPSTYIELTIHKVHDGIGRPTSGPKETGDDRLGFLIVGNHVRTVVSSHKVNGPCPGVWHYWLDTPDEHQLIRGSRERNEWARATLLLGTTAKAIRDDEQKQAIANGTRIRCVIPSIWKDIREWDEDTGAVKQQITNLIMSAAGEMRTLWAALLLISQHRRHLRFQEVPRHVSFVPKRKVFMGHTIVNIPITAPENMRHTYYPNTRASPVGHEVRGHWMHWHRGESCLQRWPGSSPIPDDKGHFTCAGCNGFWTWKKQHHRGDAGHGISLQTWEVTP